MIYPWMSMLMIFAGSLLFFSQVYRFALLWFVRARIDYRWEIRAELATLAASIPFAVACALLSIELSILFGDLAISTGLDFVALPQFLEFLSQWRPWLIGIICIVFLARVVPQTIAGSKVYAYAIEEKFRDQR